MSQARIPLCHRRAIFRGLCPAHKCPAKPAYAKHVCRKKLHLQLNMLGEQGVSTMLVRVTGLKHVLSRQFVRYRTSDIVA